jgi:Pyruvate/2-oxoacid:ferredoxin oxidoreductase delta subunit
MGRWIIPGMEGTGAYAVALVLALKGYSVRGVMGLDMPVSWLALHPGFDSASAEMIISSAKQKVTAFTGDVFSGRRHWGGILSLILGLSLLPVTLAYLLMGRFWLAKLFFANERCNGCGICAQSCPRHAIHMWSGWFGQPAKPYWTYSCESCMRCMAYCPQQAVEASHTLAFLLYFAAAIPITLLVFKWMAGIWPALAGLNNEFTRALVQYAIRLILIAVIYLIFSALTRLPIFGWMASHTTLTRWYRRYHAPGVGLPDIITTKEIYHR